jgi:molecular chaperone DnaK
MEARKGPRLPKAFPVKLTFAGADDFLRSYTENTNLGGVFVRTNAEVPLGTRVDLTIELAPGKGLTAVGEVAWRRGAESGQAPGVGVRFVQIEPAYKQWLDTAVQAYLAKAPAPRPTIPTPAPTAVSAGRGTRELVGISFDTDEPIVGIDLGTSNSAACVFIDGKPVIIDLSDPEMPTPGNRTLPSVIAYDDAKHVTVGVRAQEGLRTNPKRTIFGAKRFIGRTYDSPVVQSMLTRFPYKVVPDADGRVAVEINGAPLALTAISAEILRSISEKCERQLHRAIRHAIITVPAYYNDNQRMAVVHAGRIAGLTVERILNEPTAAAIAYGLSRAEPCNFFVYDLGGGTFDVSVMTVDREALQVLATAGDTFLGGEDFDDVLVQEIYDQFAKNTGKRLSQNHAARALIKAAAEKAKARLSTHETTMVVVREAQLHDNTTARLELEVSRARLQELVEPMVTRTLQICDQALQAAQIRIEQLTDVVMVGGQTRMPYIRQRVQAHFRKAPRCDLNPDEVVALGAGMLPHVAAEGGVCFSDVLSMSIGIAVDSRFESLIARNTPVPCSKTISIQVPRAQFAKFTLEVWQGDEGELRRNEHLGSVRVDSLEPGDNDPVPVQIDFILSDDCLLTIQLTNKTTGQSHQAVLLTSDV